MSTARSAALLTAALAAAGCGALNPGRELPSVDYRRVHAGAEALAFDAGSELLASGGWNGDVALWRPGAPAPIRHFKAHEGAVQDLAFVRSRLLSAGADGRIRVWDRDGALASDRDAGAPVERMVAMGDRVVSAHRDGALRFWRLPGLEPDGEAALHRGAVAALAAHADGRLVASSGFDGRVFLLRPGEAPRELEGPPTDARSLAFSPDGARLYGGGWFKLFRWEVDGGGLTVLDTAHWGVISSLRVAPGGRAIASISRVNDSAVLFLDPDSGKTLRDLRRHPVCGTALAMSPDGRYLANTGDDGAVRIFDLEHPRLQ